MSAYLVTRRIGIDAGHRIRSHGSKCRNIHGHRYEIEAVCRADHLHGDGEQSGMVVDFGFLKEEMMRLIDAPCDHGFIADINDADLLAMFGVSADALRAEVAENGFAITSEGPLASKLYVVPFPPTAEALARHWFDRLAKAVEERSDGVGALASLRVWETPNCWAEYTPG